MTELKTEAALLTALNSSSKRPLSALEIQRQRVSFVMGTLKMTSDMTREQVQHIVAMEAGKTEK